MALSKVDPNFLNVSQVGGRRNLIINGAMQVAQRGTSFSLAHDGERVGYAADRFQLIIGTGNDTLDGTVANVSDAPDGFTNSIKWTTGTAETIDADDAIYIQQRLEGQDLQHLQWGGSGAKQVTLSFYVKSSVTGTYNTVLYSVDDTRSITSTYTINSADTWEKKTITFVGDTTGVIDNDAGEGLRVAWNLAVGSDYTSEDSTSWGAHVNARWGYGHAQNGVVTTASATWQITGVQLEVGDTATPFEHRSYGEEEMACQRYYIPQLYSAESGYATGTGQTARAMNGVNFPVAMRDAPDITVSVGSLSNGTSLGASGITKQRCHLTCTSSNSGSVYWTCNLELDAEL